MGIWQTAAEWSSSGRITLSPPYTNQICRSENWLCQPDHRNGIIKSPTPTLHGDEMRPPPGGAEAHSIYCSMSGAWT